MTSEAEQLLQTHYKSVLELAKGHRLPCSVALEFWKRNSTEKLLNSFALERQDKLVHRWFLNGDLNVSLEEGYLVELVGEGLFFCMKWVISEYYDYIQNPESRVFPRIIYIDTCASLSVLKWNEWIKRQYGWKEHSYRMQQFWSEYFYYYRVVDAYEFMAVLKSLHHLLQQYNNLPTWLMVDNFTYQLEPFDSPGNLPYLLLYECYRLTKLYNTLTFLITISSSNSEMVSPLERFSSFFDIRLKISESIQNRVKIIKSPDTEPCSFHHVEEETTLVKTSP